MLQIDHIYEFLYQNIFKNNEIYYCFKGVVVTDKIDIRKNIVLFNPPNKTKIKIFCYDQEPFIGKIARSYINVFLLGSEFLVDKTNYNDVLSILHDYTVNNTNCNKIHILITSEYSLEVDSLCDKMNFQKMYYFFHGFAALDWYRGYYAINYHKNVVKSYSNDFISYNRIIHNDRSYRIYFISKLLENNLVQHGLISFGVDSESKSTWQDEIVNPDSKLSTNSKKHILENLIKLDKKLIIDGNSIPGSASASIPITVTVDDPENNMLNLDSFWHVVTETVFYYDKLHLTEKIFKPIVSKQPFMLLAAPGNLAYLKSYGFKTFDSVIDESYDDIQDPDQRIDAVVDQLNWYCNLTDAEKLDIAEKLEPIIEHNFHHFYGEFRHIITRELLGNCQTLFKELGYDDNDIAYDDIYRVLTA
jgi:hypothetical protein